jgi:hypothetical protein
MKRQLMKGHCFSEETLFIRKSPQQGSGVQMGFGKEFRRISEAFKKEKEKEKEWEYMYH